MCEKLWNDFRAGYEDSRKKLIEYYIPLVKALAKTINYRIPKGTIKFEELVSAGVLGLVKALENYNPDLGLKFTTYAIPRVRGAILDELRRIDYLPRSARDKVKLYKRKASELMAKLGRQPFKAEIAEEMELPISGLQYYERFKQPPLSLYEDRSSDSDGDLKLADSIPQCLTNPLKDVEIKERKRLLIDAINLLETKEKVIIGLHYMEGIPFKKISRLFGATESRISQIHTGALKKIRINMDNIYYQKGRLNER